MIYAFLGLAAAAFIAYRVKPHEGESPLAWAVAGFAAPLIAMGLAGLGTSSLIITVGWSPTTQLADVAVYVTAFGGYAAAIYGLHRVIDIVAIDVPNPYAEVRTPTLEPRAITIDF